MKLDIPKGYRVDLENSDLIDGVIILKSIEPELVNFEELGHICGYAYRDSAGIEGNKTVLVHRAGIDPRVSEVYKPTAEDAISALALGKLLQLRRAAIGDWKVEVNVGMHIIDLTCSICFRSLGKSEVHYPLSFPNKRLAERFRRKYKDLLVEYTRYEGKIDVYISAELES